MYGTVPPHPKDPIEKSPAPPGHPAHALWERATREAERKLAQLEENHLAERPNPGEDPGTWLLRRYVGTFHIWAERGLSIVLDYEGARAYEQWLKAYREDWLKMLEDNPSRITAPNLLLALLSNQLQGAVSHWYGIALDKVAAFADEQAKSTHTVNEAPTIRPAEIEASSPASDDDWLKMYGRLLLKFGTDAEVKRRIGETIDGNQGPGSSSVAGWLQELKGDPPAKPLSESLRNLIQDRVTKLYSEKKSSA